MTYRVGRHWGVTIVREGDRTPEGHIVGADQLVAVVTNGDTALAERICALLNADVRPPLTEPFELPRAGGHRLTQDSDAVTCGIGRTGDSGEEG